MTIDPGLVLKIKNNIRIKHSKLDADIEDSIQTALADLEMCGVKVLIVEESGDLDPLILNAVKLFCKAEYTDDPVKAAEYQRRYDSMKSSLMMAGKYREVSADE
jgi:ribosomal protein S3